MKHAGQSVAIAAFYGLSVLGCATSAVYTKLTPNMSVHFRSHHLLSYIDIISLLGTKVSF